MADNIRIKPGQEKTRAYFLEQMKPGNVIAFNSGSRMLSGKIQEIDDKKVTVKTKNGSVFFVDKKDIVWVLTGSRWPIGIYNALRYKKDGE